MVAPFEALAAIPEARGSRGRAAALRRHHDLQRIAQQRNPCGRYSRSAWHRRTGPSRCSVRSQDGLSHDRHRAWCRQGALASELGAHLYLDSTTQDIAAELNKLGGARLILSTVTNSQAMSAVLGGLAVDGKMIVVGASPDPIEVPPLLLIGGRRGIHGWPSGTSIDSEDTLAFSALANIRPMIETMPLERAAEAYERMMSGAARFRMVITTGL